MSPIKLGTFLLFLVFHFYIAQGYPKESLKWNYFPEKKSSLELSNEDCADLPSSSERLKLQRLKDVNYGPARFVFGLFDKLKVLHVLDGLGKRLSRESLCITCKVAVRFLQYTAKSGATEDDIGNIINFFCTHLNIEEPPVCSGLVKMFKKEVSYVIVKVALDPNEFCGMIINNCANVVNPLHKWNVTLPPFPKPPVSPPKPPKSDAPKLKVLHLSDVHIDPHYKEGSNANCVYPLCCRKESGNVSSQKDAAGYWGDYRNCDTPLRTFENMLFHINKTHKFDYVIWTGDIPPHNIWNNSREEAVWLLHSASKIIHKYLGSMPIYPALGNHESSPVNSFPVPQIKGKDSISWLYSEVVKAWNPWIPSSDTLKLGAYYSIQVYPGLRIISLNMNYCNNLNWWLLVNSTDPTGELAWLVTELQKAEDKKEKVHIIGHIPPGDPDCLPVWSFNYHKIINRYESTVTAQFFGHTHKDEFEIFYDKSGSKPRPISIAYVGPSVSTYDGVNPGYRIYTVDGNYNGSSRVVLDHETYFLNLTEANASKKATWKLEYSAKSAFNMSSLLPADWDALTRQFEKDDKLFQLFYRYYFKMSDLITSSCDETCKKALLCKLRRGQSNDPLICA